MAGGWSLAAWTSRAYESSSRSFRRNPGRACRKVRLLHVFRDFLAEVRAFCMFSWIFLQKASSSASFLKFSCRRRLPLHVFSDFLAEDQHLCKFFGIFLHKASSSASFLRVSCRSPSPLQGFCHFLAEVEVFSK